MNKMTLLKLIKCGIGFLSSIPVGITMDDIEMLMNKLYIYPFIGTLIGIIIGSISYIIISFFPKNIASILVIYIIYYITLFNHLDGIGDFGDGIIAHGSIDKKRRALKDTSLGIGGVGFVILYIFLLYNVLLYLISISNFTLLHIDILKNYIILFFGIFSNLFLYNPIIFVSFVLVISEILGKQSMLIISSFGNPFHDGLGSYTINGAKKNKTNLYIGLLYSFFASLILLGCIGMVSYIISSLSSLYILYISNKHFQGLNGDGIGVSNEVGRLISILSVIISLKLIMIGDYLWML